jgi:hypothetical protein
MDVSIIVGFEPEGTTMDKAILGIVAAVGVFA